MSGMRSAIKSARRMYGTRTKAKKSKSKKSKKSKSKGKKSKSKSKKSKKYHGFLSNLANYATSEAQKSAKSFTSKYGLGGGRIDSAIESAAQAARLGAKVL
jgi:hypothetical protein